MHQVAGPTVDAIVRLPWFEFIKAISSIVTAVIAALALRNWQRQDKAKREAEFLDALIETGNAYVSELSRPTTVLGIAKIAMKAHAPTWEDGDSTEIALKGAMAFIEKDGERLGKTLFQELEVLKLSTIKLRSLATKGHIFRFKNYGKCQSSVKKLTWHFDRMQAFAAVIQSSSWNWSNPEVKKTLLNIMTIDPDEIRDDSAANNAVLIAFARSTYEHIYG
jgi:hypothetical protein